MKQTRSVEFGTGLFVFLGIAALFFLTTQTANVKGLTGDDGYVVRAQFENVGSLKVRAPVQMSGVTIGRVESIDLHPEFLIAQVTMRIASDFDQIPDDSDASILTQGLLGGQYVGIEAGGSESYLAEQSEIEFTQSAIVLEKLVSKYLLGQASGE